MQLIRKEEYEQKLKEEKEKVKKESLESGEPIDSGKFGEKYPHLEICGKNRD